MLGVFEPLRSVPGVQRDRRHESFTRRARRNAHSNAGVACILASFSASPRELRFLNPPCLDGPTRPSPDYS